MTIHTREEAIARAKAWVDKVGGAKTKGWEEVHRLGAPGTASGGCVIMPDMFIKDSDGGGCGGFVIVVDRGGDDEGTIVAIVDYDGVVKKFHWKEHQEL